MYLSCLTLDIASPSVRQCLKNGQDMHRNVMHLFPDVPQENARETMGVLYRLMETKNEVRLYILSGDAPDFSDLQKGFQVMEGSPKPLDVFLTNLVNGRRLRFDLLAMPSKKVKGEGKNSKRILLRDENERAQWLERKGMQNGFQVLYAREDGQQKTSVQRETQAPVVVHEGVRFCGELVITDETRFRQAFANGIGAEKAYGMGMLMLFAANGV